jgi:pimeloyl-ACP methyl ester carboxylesterase
MAVRTTLLDAQRIHANGAILHTETRGSGPPVLLIPAAGGDAAVLAGVADALADGFAVTTYDRRGNSRSPRPAGWAQTSVAEQADDAAALLAALGQRPAVVVGTSAGGSVALEVALRHPEAVRAAIIHEPPILAGTTNPQAVTDDLGAMIQQGMAAGGPRTAMELFLRWAAGDATFEAIDPADRDRYLGNGEVFIGVELPPFMAYAPAVEAIADAPGPIVAADSASPHPLPVPGGVMAGPPGRHRPGRGPRRPHGLPHRTSGGGRAPAPAAARPQLSDAPGPAATGPAGVTAADHAHQQERITNPAEGRKHALNGPTARSSPRCGSGWTEVSRWCRCMGLLGLPGCKLTQPRP